ncbi:hypothetical protein JHK82_031228 [Glycine max]|nr:hypothetical protein JHK82_031228 [Glycine max]KAG5145918.1 hypothetical protein JHK84_031461 [Glycine max]
MSNVVFALDSHLVTSVVCNLLLNYITRPRVPFNRASYSILYDGSQNSVLKRVSFVAGMGVEIEQRPLLLARWCKQYRNFEGEWGQRIIEREKGGRR